jgi:hypothetical protein
LVCEYPEDSEGVLIFDTVNTSENRNRPDSIAFIYNGRPVAIIGAASYEIRKPHS